MSPIARDIIWLPATRPTPNQIIANVAHRRGLTVQDLLGSSKLKPISQARQEAMWELRKRARLSLPAIARRLNRTDHTTALHGIRRHEARMSAQQVDA